MPRLDAAECRRRFAAARHAYLATTREDGAPHVVPVTFALVPPADDAGHLGEIVTAVDHKPKTSGDLQRLRNLAARPRAAVLADLYDDDWSRLWWVRADGTTTTEDPAEGAPATARGLAALADRYPQYRERPPAGPVVRVRVERWTGWEAATRAAR